MDVNSLEEGENGGQRQKLLRKKLAEMQRMQEAEAQLRSVLRAAMESDAYERLMNVRISSPEVYMQVARVIVTLHSNKQLAAKVSEKDLRGLLVRLTEKHEGTIDIKRK
ncbi:MAG: DNA-binding protein [Candidatus Burarchaeum sp.]|nr:DNA-binding protein [Candidatus Burarchaeum sp.]MDO8339453.1 DNA-binding protein [Candidatus Burarchaeum sp.]